MTDHNKKSAKKKSPPTASFDSTVLGPGSKIGQFKIERELGRGAVGIVYLAHDTKLDREVAIKSLPEEVVSNPLVRARFQREARLLAGLNHPNIATIYEELEEVEDTSYLVLEYIAGETLSERIEKGPLSIDEALLLSQQIAEAVAAAHEQGVIHRDLKPANIKITPDGKVKVLDFGLAKGVSGEAADQQSTITVPGRVIGTPAYMSPEQARGNPTDHRSDIWSFGCVLFEMLTGKIPFKGDTVSDTLANILQSSPEWEKLPESIPANIKVLIRRCMEKDQQKRLYSMVDVVIEISETIQLPQLVPPVTSTAGVAKTQVGKRMLVGIVSACLAIVIFSISLITLISKSQPTPISQPIYSDKFEIPPDVRLAIFPGNGIAISPDGKNIAYIAENDENQRLFVRPVDKLESTPLFGTEDATYPFFSPDSKSIGFFTNEAKLKRIDFDGSNLMTITDIEKQSSSFFSRGATWGKNDTIIFSTTCDSRLIQVPATTGTPIPITTLNKSEGISSHRWPHMLPDGKHVLFTIYPTVNRREDLRVCILSLETKKWETLIFEESYNARYVPFPSKLAGHIIYMHQGVLMAVPFNLQKLKITGKSKPLLENINTMNTSYTAYYSISDNGTLVYMPFVESEVFRRTIAWVDRGGMVTSLIEEHGAYLCPRISPDGRFLALQISDEGISNIWVYDIERNTRNRLTFEGANQEPTWTPEGKRISFASNRDGIDNLYWKLADGSGDAEQIFSGERYQYPCSWSTDGELLAFYEREQTGQNRDIRVLSIQDRTTSTFLNSESNERAPMFSPDGNWITYVSNELGRDDIFVRRFPFQEGMWTISDGGGTDPMWAPDGKEIFYRNGDEMWSVTVETRAGFEVIGRQLLFKGDYYRGTNYTAYDYDPKSDRFLMIKNPEEVPERQINVVVNWFEELNKFVPTDKN